ncbi:hypothetical protein [Nitrosococcus halophilus]|uniref:hypothetical protein n=1 Tax=Nitrosococcus halophilus TaxID=133539 RepID=UPI0012FE8748|nr:hypothetical protein [Nitrosococcus halophilus]
MNFDFLAADRLPPLGGAATGLMAGWRCCSSWWRMAPRRRRTLPSRRLTAPLGTPNCRF